MEMPPRCENCLAALTGPYCHQCGQRVWGPEALTVASLLRDWGRNVTSLDSKTMRSIGTLLRPGRLTSAYLSGRRQPYLGPLKLYLICTAIFFLAAPAAGFSLDGMMGGSLAGIEPQVSRYRDASGLDPTVFAARFDIRFQTIYTAVISVSVVGGALLLSLLFLGQRRPIGAHLVFMLHYMCFLFLLTAAVGMIMVQAQLGPLLTLAVVVFGLFLYMSLALGHVYRQHPVLTMVKAGAMIVFGMVVDSLVTLAAVFFTVWTI